MNVYSRKRRRRMHALPAAIALIAFAVLWLISNQSSAETLLSAQSLGKWNKDCRRCVIEVQYDVMKGEIIRLEADMGEASLDKVFVSEGSRPVIAWSWSVDSFDLDRHADLFRVTVDLRSEQSGTDYRVHYAWDPTAKTGDYDALGGNEFVWVVCGSDCKSRRWYSVERDLTLDFSVLTESEDSVTPVRFEAALGDPSGRKTKAGGYLESIVVNYLPEPVPEEPVATSD